MDTLARDLNRHYRELDQQERDDEFRDGVQEELDLIKGFAAVPTFENVIKARDHAQYIIDLCNDRLPR